MESAQSHPSERLRPVQRIRLVIFRLDRQYYALPLEVVERIVHAVEVTPLPAAPAVVLGIINLQGRVIPVVNMRRRFGLPEREIGLSDQLLIAQAGGRAVALLVDDTEGVAEESHSAVTDVNSVMSSVEQFRGVVQLNDHLVLIHDLDKLLSPDEARALEEAQVREA